jgi:hypothetical protein
MDLRHKGGATINLVRPISSMDAMRAYLEARIIMLFAGAMAQTLPSAPVGAKRVDLSDAAAILNGALGAERDDAKIRELRHLLRNISYPDTDLASSDRIATELKAINDCLWLRAQEMVEALAESITGLGAAMVDRMVLVEQWGRPADTYEVVLTGEKLERIWPVR